MAAIFTRTCFCISFFIFIFNSACFSQFDLSGRVEDETTKTPIFNACIYLNGTTIFTNADGDGNFLFKNLRLINTEIVVYAPGYEILVFKPTAKSFEGQKLVFRLQPRVPISQKLAVANESKNQAFIAFRETLLGFTSQATDCVILNEDALYFVAGETSTGYKIMADTPLIIVNKKLGYKINYNLVEYSVDILNKEQKLYGYARYRELGNPADYSDNRRNVYYGSSMHFLRSLVNHQTYQDLFDTYWMKPVKDFAKLKPLPRNLLFTDKDTVLLEPAEPMDMLFIDSTNELTMHLPYKLLVHYDRDPYEKFYLLSNGRSNGLTAKGATSYFKLTTPSIGINYLGVLDDYSNVEYTGYWSYELLANKLPLNYDPGK